MLQDDEEDELFLRDNRSIGSVKSRVPEEDNKCHGCNHDLAPHEKCFCGLCKAAT